MRESPVVNTDTGWRDGGSTAHLIVFVGEQSTVYQIRARHRNQEAQEVIPADYAGVMGNRSRQKLRCRGIRCRRATEVPGPSSAQPYESVGDQAGPGARVR